MVLNVCGWVGALIFNFSLHCLIVSLLLLMSLQIRGMHTLIRDSQTTKHDFVFYSDRLIRLVCTDSFCIIEAESSFFFFAHLLSLFYPFQVVEHGLGHLPFTEKQVITPTGKKFIAPVPV